MEELRSLSHQYLVSKNQDFRRYLIESKPMTHPLTIIVGQRGIGKTTTLIQLLLDRVKGNIQDKSILYVPADHMLMTDYSLYEIAEKFHLAGGKYIAFDEIHKYIDWSKELKSITDTFSELKIFASGSSALEIYQGSHDLSRRAVIYNMLGLSLREYIGLYYDISLPKFSLATILKDHEKIAFDIIAKLKQKQQKIMPLFNAYCQRGYYPFMKHLTDEAIFDVLLEQNINATLEGDLLSIYPELNGNSIRKIKLVLGFVAAHVPYTPTWIKLKETVGVADQRTLKNYFKYLEDAELLYILRPAGNKFNKIEKNEKIYFNNTNLLRIVASSLPNKGAIRETFLLSMLNHHHLLEIPAKGDFLIDNTITIEVGGKNKSNTQIHSLDNAYRACDEIEVGIGNKIPLWLFGFLY